jgi:hypothetical protein
MMLPTLLRRVASSVTLAAFCFVPSSSALAQSPAAPSAAQTAQPAIPANLGDPLKRLTPDLAGGKTGEKGSLVEWIFKSAKTGLEVAVGDRRCEPSACDALQSRLLLDFNRRLARLPDARVDGFAPNDEFSLRWTETGKEFRVLSLVFDGRVTTWTLSETAARKIDFDKLLDELRFAAGRERYDTLNKADNVRMGRAGATIFKYARQLLTRNMKPEALPVLRSLLATWPDLYEAHVALMSATPDAKEAQRSAEIVFANAEDQGLVDAAAKLLGRSEPKVDDLPLLSGAPAGMMLVIAPADPCSLRLAQEGAAVFTAITGVETQFVRLPEGFPLGEPDRAPFQKSARALIGKFADPDIDFTGWTSARYVAELTQLAQGKDLVTKFDLLAFAERMKTTQQRNMGPRLQKLTDHLTWNNLLPPASNSTVVVVTEANMSDGDANFITDTSFGAPGRMVAIASYAMMEARNNGDAMQSRQRLAERLGKELVVVMLKALGVARPTDPRDPYSYANSIARIDEKGLKLSPPTQEALDKLKAP